MTAKPECRFVASLGSAVEPLIHSPESVQSARIGGIGMIDDSILEDERAHARPLARVRGRVSPGHGREFRDRPLVLARSPLSSGLSCERLLCRGFALVVVFNASVALLLLCKPHVEVEVEVTTK